MALASLLPMYPVVQDPPYRRMRYSLLYCCFLGNTGFGFFTNTSVCLRNTNFSMVVDMCFSLFSLLFSVLFAEIFGFAT